MPLLKEYHVLSLGAGVQSTTVYLLSLDSQLPLFDAAIFADTQEEPEHVYRHLEWLQGLRGAPIYVRTRGKLGDDLLKGLNSTGQRFISIPAYTKPDGLPGTAVGMTRRQCTKEYKTSIIDRTIRREILGLKWRQRWSSDVIVHNYFGISADEAGRARRIEAVVRMHQPNYRPHFPLLDLNWTRADCIRFLEGRVPHQVGRSACVFCPFKSDAEWLRLKRHDPSGWARAVEVDEGLRSPEARKSNRKFDHALYIHRSGRPLAEADLNERQGTLGFLAECEGLCGV